MKHVPQHDSMFTRVLSESNVNAGIAADGSKLWKDQRTQKLTHVAFRGSFCFHALRLQRRMKYVVKESVATLIFCSEHEEFFMLQMKHIMNNCATILQTTTGSTRVLHRLRHSHVSSKVGTSRALHHLTISLASHLSLCLVLSSGVSLWFSCLALSTPIECEPRLRNEQRECVRKIPQAELYKKKPRLALLLNITHHPV